jgi:hypothetical protein
MKKSVLMAVAVFAASAASAEFEGVLHMKMTSGQGTGTLKVSLSKAGVRNEMNLSAAQSPLAFTTLLLFSQPDVVYRIDDRNRTFAEIDIGQARRMAGRQGGETYSVRQLGSETVLGYRCQHVVITGSRSGATELWTTREIAGYDAYSSLRAADAGGAESAAFLKALKDAGADGFPVKSIHSAGPAGQVVMELVKVEKKSLPPGLFQVPAGYTREDAFSPGGLPPDARNALQEQMRNMSPEQRQMLENMMRQQAQ